MPQESNMEFKVGLFVLTALLGLTFFIFSVTDSSVFEQGRSLKVVFGFANGLKKSAPVRIAGVNEGLVKDLSLFFDPGDGRMKVNVELRVKKGIRIPRDSVVTINQLGLMGEKYVEIIPGTNTVKFFEEGDILTGEDPIAQEAISQRVMEVAGKLEDSIGGLGKIVNDQKNLDSLHATLEHLSSMTGNLDEIMSDVKNGEGTLGRLLYDERLYDDLQGLTADLKENPWKLLYRPKTKDQKPKTGKGL